MGKYRDRWTDPAPLEIARPRLPWWTLLPRPVLVVLSPVLVLAVATAVTVAGLRRAYRYPLASSALVSGVLLGLWWGWLALVVPAVLALVGAGWWWLHRDSFERALLVQVRSEWRRLAVYAFRWRRVMVFSDLSKKVQRRAYVPRLARVRSDGWRDRVTVRLLPGQAPAHYEEKADALAHSFGARSCRVRVLKPRRLVLDFIHSDPLERPLPVPELAADGSGVDLRKLPVGRTENGRPWLLRLLGNQLLVVGTMGAGKASVVWALLWALAPLIRSGQVQVFGIDPKGGMELGKAPRLFQRLICDNGVEAVTLLEQLASRTKQRAQSFQGGRRKWSLDSGEPFVLLVVDELADVIAYQTDRKLRDRANNAVQTITSQGRAPGVAVVGELQDPRKEIVSFRHLFNTRIALRLDEPEQVDMVLGDGVRERGAAAHEIPEATPGVAWAKEDGRREPLRARAFNVTDADLDALTEYVTSPVPSAGVDVRRIDPAPQWGDAA